MYGLCLVIENMPVDGVEEIILTENQETLVEVRNNFMEEKTVDDMPPQISPFPKLGINCMTPRSKPNPDRTQEKKILGKIFHIVQGFPHPLI